MKKWNASIVTGLVLLLALAACANPATNKPEAQVGEPVATDGSKQADAEEFILAEGSKIGFVGSKVTGSHEGGFTAFEGAIELVRSDVTRSSVEVEIDTTSLWSDNDRLTGHLKSPDFFDVEKFPRATFTSTAIAREGEDYTITGNLDLHGVTKSIKFPAKIEVGADRVTAQAEFFIQRFDFKIEYAGKADDLIRDEVVIKLDLAGTPAAS